MGGSIAAYYAGAFPERVHRLALLEGLGPPESKDSMPARVATLARRVEEGARARAEELRVASTRRRRASPSTIRWSRPRLARFLAEKGTTPALGGRIRFKHDPLHATPGPYGFSLAMAEQFWRRVKCPTLIVAGAQSLMRHAPVGGGAARPTCFPHGRRAVVEGAGHMMQRHQPARARRAVARISAGG